MTIDPPAAGSARSRTGRPGAAAAPTPWAQVAVLVFAVVGVLTLLLTLFAWPAVRSDLRDIPLVVTGPGPAVAQVEARLEAARPGAFDLDTVPDEAAARAALADREAYGAILADPQRPRVLVASGASPVVAQALGQIARGLAAGSGAGATAAPVEDVVPTPADDPRGAGLAAGALPLAIGGIAAAALLSLRIVGLSRRVIAAFAVAVLAGPALVGILHGWLGALSGDFLVESAAVALGLGATTLAVLGLYALLREAGLALGALIVVLLGNPLSAASTAPEMLPAGLGPFGQALPPGALITLLRSISAFDGAGALRPVLVLTGWALAGLALLGVAGLRSRRAGGAEQRRPAPLRAA